MASVRAFVASVGSAIALLAVLAAPAVAECWPPPPSREGVVPVKFAFVATVAEVSHVVDPPRADSAPFDWHVELAVEKTYRGRVPDKLRLSGWDEGCSYLRPAGLREGDQVFVVLDRLDLVENPSLFGQILVWRREADAWSFANEALQSGDDPAVWPSAARRATSLSEILALVREQSAPDTATGPQRPQSGGLPGTLALALVLVVAFGAAFGSLRFRSPAAAGRPAPKRGAISAARPPQRHRPSALTDHEGRS